VALGVDPPARGELLELVVERPAVGARLALVLGVRALERHAVRVVADGAQLVDLRFGQRLGARYGGEFGALLLDRLGVLARLLDQRGGDRAGRAGGGGAVGREARRAAAA